MRSEAIARGFTRHCDKADGPNQATCRLRYLWEGCWEVFRIGSAIWLTVFLAGCACSGFCNDSPSISIVGSYLTADGDAELRLSVTDTAGRPVRGLGPANFRSTVSGKPVPFDLTPADDGSPLAVILAIDTSRSLAGEPMASAKEGAKSFADQLGPKDTVCLITFSHEVRVAADYTDDHDQINNIIDGLEAIGTNTLLYSALVTCSRQAARAPSSRCAVVLLTDGKDEGSDIPFSQAVAEAQKCGVPFFTLAYGDQANKAVLSKISRLTGGRFRAASAPDQTVRLYQEIAQELKNQYVVRVYHPFGFGWRTFEVEVNVAGHTNSDKRRIYIPFRPQQSGNSRAVWMLVICALLAAAIIAYRRSRRWTNDQCDSEEGRDEMDGYDVSGQSGWRPASDVSGPGTSDAGGRGWQVWLEVVNGPHRGTEFALTGRPVRIGRGSDCELSLEKDGAVSRLHADITLSNTGHFVLRDLGSKNGIRIQGNELADRSVRLRDGDRISLGATELIYRDERPKRKPR